jgi:hypothetical protein
MWGVGIVTVRSGGNVTRGGGLLSKETLYRVQQGDFQREQKDEKRAKGRGGTWGGGGRMGETEGNYRT